jgi:hypothetical protein
MQGILARLRERLASSGLNLVGVAPAARYDAAVPARWALGPHAPGVRSVVVIGSGGGEFWRAFREAPPAGAADPLDAFTRATVTAAVAPLFAAVDGPIRLVFPFDHRPPVLSFVHLAECAGLGRQSLLGVLVHPEFGPWFALRAAVLLPVPLVAPRPADGFDPCPTCVERPCITACPAGAVGPAGWDVPRCAAHRLSGTGDACDGGCHARIACVLGRPHRYPADALAFHQAAARWAMAAVTRRP